MKDLQTVNELRHLARDRASERNVPLLGENLFANEEQLTKHEVIRHALGASLITLVNAPESAEITPPAETPVHGFYRGVWDIAVPKWGLLQVITKHKEQRKEDSDALEKVVYDGEIYVAGKDEQTELSPDERRLITVLDHNALEHGLPSRETPQYVLSADIQRMKLSLLTVQSICSAAGAKLELPYEATS